METIREKDYKEISQIQSLKNQIEFLIGDMKSISKKLEYRKRFKNVLNNARSDRELEISLIGLLNDIER